MGQVEVFQGGCLLDWGLTVELARLLFVSPHRKGVIPTGFVTAGYCEVSTTPLGLITNWTITTSDI